MSAADCLFQIKRSEDAIVLLDLYLKDNPNTKYKSMIETEKLRFKTLTKDEAGAKSEPANTAPAADAPPAADTPPASDQAEENKESPKEEPEQKKEETDKEATPDKTVDKTETNK
jgi:hypothetical protein